MKINKHIVSKYLAAYFTVLPILFGLLSYGHIHYTLNDREDAIEIVSSVDCSLCDVYESQTAVIFTALFQVIKLSNPPFYSVDAINLISISGHFNYLRGPPSII
ncbi:hypothetical protein ADICYQ_5576 [Cyclobacterium qasimii M12-11B]|uniref:Uncharacterized protein n=1 Tax=Cyclobacterium qasimii M12-11B TaxID=641524 RepID=S7V6Z5_9BACT|nr:hypothetical protein ADICYQ_5576 [Cyclobacterium qasimii M12-11B]